MGNIGSVDCSESNNNIAHVIKGLGYPVEVHTVTTEDGHILTLYRIKHGKHSTYNSFSKNNAPVLLIHGLFGCCTEWLNGEHGLGYFLADHDFDVWIGNCRGTTYSRQHVRLDCEKDRNEFWDFSWHEIGYYDIPAFIDFILESTKFTKIYYIGYSQGTTACMVLMSSRCNYNEKVCLCVMLAPSAQYGDLTKALCIDSKVAQLYKLMLNLHGPTTFPITSFTRKLGQIFGGPDSCFKNISDHFMFYFFKHILNKENIGEMNVQQICQNFPNDASIKQIVHYTQVIKEGSFKRFDYGNDQNRQFYGSDTPPMYDLSKMNVPVALFVGTNDIFCQLKDAEALENLFGNVVHKHIIEREDFRHGDFIYAEDVTILINVHVLEIMKKYTHQIYSTDL